MDAKESILNALKKNRSAKGRDMCRAIGISRQALHKHIKVLIEKGEVVKLGGTRGAAYSLSSKREKHFRRKLTRIISLKGAHEDYVFREMDSSLGISRLSGGNSYAIFQYAFTEILNNAIDHSCAKKCSISIAADKYRLSFEIRDKGIGIFNSIRAKFGLPDENSAVGELLKGKTTTMRERHTGEGIFFTSKLGDEISFRSHGIELFFNNLEDDVFVESKKYIRGTDVRFTISRFSKKIMKNLFLQYAPEEFDFKFERTKVIVKLFQKDYISRSEAKRLVSGLDKFKELILDFKDVRSVSQGFADELFRVFMASNPEIKVEVRNAGGAVLIMFRHVFDNNTINRLTIS